VEAKLAKGYLMEEVLRRYFIRSGHYTLRGVPFVYQGFEVTDIDIWAYDRPSPVSRQRIIVDCKNKSTPKAIERIFWTKGLQEVLGIEQAIVATTDKRNEVADFGREHGVVILDGNFLARLEKSTDGFAQRLTEEQFIGLLASYHPTKEGGDWKTRVKAAKKPFATGLSFNAINSWIHEGNFFAEQTQVVLTHREQAYRVLYLLLSFISIGFDFVLKDFTFSEASIRYQYVDEGLRHGSPGMTNTNQVLRYAMGLIEHYAPESRNVATKVKERLKKDLDSLSTRMLAEYVCKPSVSQELFGVAKELEAAAYKTEFVAPNMLSSPAKSLLLLFADFWNMDRTKLLNSFEHQASAQGQTQPVQENVQSSPIEPTTDNGPDAPSDEQLKQEQQEQPQEQDQAKLPGLD
jgi:hypothetical protein